MYKYLSRTQYIFNLLFLFFFSIFRVPSHLSAYSEFPVTFQHNIFRVPCYLCCQLGSTHDCYSGYPGLNLGGIGIFSALQSLFGRRVSFKSRDSHEDNLSSCFEVSNDHLWHYEQGNVAAQLNNKLIDGNWVGLIFCVTFLWCLRTQLTYSK